MSTHDSVIFLSHGGGPLPLLGDPGHSQLVEHFNDVASQLAETAKPDAIVVISAHWETTRATITHAAQPELIYDYFGFPDEAYEIEYPSPGAPQLAEKLLAGLQQCDIDAELDDHRGLDHGVFVPLKLLYPQADIPCIQVSLNKSLDPQHHIELGRAIGKTLKHCKDNILVIGSGFTFHNLRAFITTDQKSQSMNQEFEAWLIDTMTNSSLSEEQRANSLANWESAPHARYCHPREEHLLPLLVCYGITGAASPRVYEMQVMNKKVSSYAWM